MQKKKQALSSPCYTHVNKNFRSLVPQFYTKQKNPENDAFTHLTAKKKKLLERQMFALHTMRRPTGNRVAARDNYIHTHTQREGKLLFRQREILSFHEKQVLSVLLKRKKTHARA